MAVFRSGIAFNRYHWLFHGLIGFIFLILEVKVNILPVIKIKMFTVNSRVHSHFSLV